MRISVIDIGTNTILLLVADVDDRGGLTPVYHGQTIARLGKGVDEQRNILPETVDRVLSTLATYDQIIRKLQSQRTIVCGTSALRDASNRDQFLDAVKKKLGMQIRVLSGEEEAFLTYRGAVSEFQKESKQQFAVLDIGGGSTELTVGTDLAVASKRSLDIGCVRLTERFLKTSPPSSLGMSQALGTIRSAITQFPSISSSTMLIGVAGTLTTLAAIDLTLPEYDPLKVSGYRLPFDSIMTIFNQLRIKTIDEMKVFPQILPGRSDVLLAGIIILIEVMKNLDADEITVSDRGLRYGVAFEEALRS